MTAIAGNTGPLLRVTQGSYYRNSFQIYKEGGEPQDLTGYGALLQVRTAPAISGAPALLTLDADYDEGSGGVRLTSDGEIKIEITHEQTDRLAELAVATLPGGAPAAPAAVSLRWELKLISPEGVPESVLMGPLLLVLEIADTNPPEEEEEEGGDES